MADPRQDSDPDGRTDTAPGRESTTGPPRWVKVFAIIALVLVLLVVVMFLAGGNHGPGRHLGTGAGGHASYSSVTGVGTSGGHRLC